MKTPHQYIYDNVTITPLAISHSPWEVLTLLGGRNSLRYPFLLHSATEYGDLGEWTFLGIDPRATFTVPDIHKRKALFTIDGKCEELEGNAFNLLREADNRFQWQGEISGNVRPPFIGGWVGAFAYELAHATENLPQLERPDHSLPDLQLGFYETILCRHNPTGRWYLSTISCENNRIDSPLSEIKKILSVDNGSLPRPALLASVGSGVSNFTRPEYEAAVRQAIDYIYDGHIFQANLSQRFELDMPGESWDLMGHLMQASPAPFAAYLAIDNGEIISSSPERFLRLRGSEVETRPIKGTRPRGHTPEEDDKEKERLLASTKDRAELNMIIDLLRNDLGRVCDYGSIRVAEARQLESYANVHHTTGIITGRLHEKQNRIDLLRACWPGGSITGAPKVRAMEIIAELEQTTRSFYTGAIGYLSIDGNMDLNIAIRTFIASGGKLTYQVGGGIVAESNPAAEYEETIAKAGGMLKALQESSKSGDNNAKNE